MQIHHVGSRKVGGPIHPSPLASDSIYFLNSCFLESYR